MRIGTFGLVGLANGLRELVRGGGGGGIRLPLTFDSNSALRSGTGGLPDDGRNCCGGLVSVSEPLGYECNRRSPTLFGVVNVSAPVYRCV